MGLFRLLILIALIAAAVWLWRRLTHKKPPLKTHAEPGAAPMVRCAHCGVHVPRQQALLAHDQWFCSRAHLEQGEKDGGR
ncbi:PP0621 family protein [Stutzerimonas nosocomialis]|uniref:PP0621 family protein n=1 Tax=Stutzerimonas nosocomialis TaxID=1056496 RepID=UPI001F4F6C10|nr:PP0621 family protein [Stutzerimonas nosocomialis]